MRRADRYTLLAIVLWAAMYGCWFGCTAEVVAQVQEQTVRINVLSLFHPVELRLRAGGRCELQLTVDDSGPMLAGVGGASVVALTDGHVQVRLSGVDPDGGSLKGRQVHAECADRDAGRIVLEVPNKLRRPYAASLTIRSVTGHRRSGVLEAVVTMPIETAVASVVEAESPPHAGIEALKAQAVAARSFFAAHGASHGTVHRGFDYCDTTHCQFLRSPPAANSVASRATQATAGLVLTFHNDDSAQDEPLAAMYARSCGGHTRTLREIGVRTQSGYPYYAVRCVYCLHHPETWNGAAGSPRLGSERDRLAWNRIHGWGAIPSLTTEDADSPITGRGVGHGLGLCQLGAADMARRGASFTQILAHYYPNTRLTSLTTH